MENIKKLRLHSGMTQKALATLLGIKQQTICKYENTDADISLQVLKKLSSIFDIPIEVLINEEIDIIDYVKNKKENINSIEESIMGTIKRLDGGKLKQLLVFLNEMSRK